MPRVLLILPTATYRAPDFLAAAERLGAEVVVASERRQALSRSIGDRALVVDLRRPDAAADAIVALAKRLPLDAVVAVDEQGVRPAALAAARLGLSGNPPRSAERSRDKAAMRAALAAAGIDQPDFRLVKPGADPAEVAAEIGFPCVVKALGLSGSRGVIRADDRAEAVEAGRRVRAIAGEAGAGAGGAALLVERYVPGAEVAVEGLLRGGELEVLAVFDKPDPLEGPYFEETIYVTPSRLPARTLAAVKRRSAEAAAVLGLRDGPVHAELRVRGERATVIELAARSIGGLCSRTLRFGLGESLEELVLRHALGLPLRSTERQPQASGVMMLPIPGAGVLREVRGLDAAGAVEGVRGVEITVRPGSVLRPLPEGDRYLGFVFARGEEPAEVEGALREAHRRLEIDLDPTPAPGVPPRTPGPPAPAKATA